MAVQSASVILERLEIATHESPIVVFKCNMAGPYFDAFFANTVVSKKMIKKYPDRLIGVFTKYDIPHFKLLAFK